MKKLKKIPKFKNTAEEQKFWQEHDSTDYIDWSKGKRAKMPKLKPSTKQISLRMPERLLNEIKIQANKEDVPYQSLMKTMLENDISSRKIKSVKTVTASTRKSTHMKKVGKKAKHAAKRKTTSASKKIRKTSKKD